MTQIEGDRRDEAVSLRMLADLLRGIRVLPDVARDFRGKVQVIAERFAVRARRRRAGFEVFPREARQTHAADLALAQRALQGDSIAVEEIWRSAQPVVLGRIYMMGLAPYEEELFELVMARVWDKLALYKGTASASLRTWVWTLAGNALRNWIRDTRGREARAIRLDSNDGERVNIAAPSWFAPDHDLAESERQASFRHMLDRIARVAAERLRPAEWELVLRVVVRGERYEAIAAELEELPGTLRARIFRSLERLREPLRRELGEEAKEYFSAFSEIER